MLNGADYTATNGTSVVLAVGRATNDIVETVAFNATSLIGTARSVTDFTATASQTTFTISYSPGYVDVYRNGVKLTNSDYTATNGTSIVLASGCIVGDIVEIVSYSASLISTAAGGSNTQIQYNNGGVLSGSSALTFNGSYALSNSGLVPGELVYRLNSTRVGADVSTVQSVFGVGVSVSASTQYQFEGVYALSKSAGTTLHTLSYGFGGTATLNNIAYTRNWQYSGTSFTAPSVSSTGFILQAFVQTAAQTSLTSNEGTNAAAAYWIVYIRGTVSVNAAGTFIPQYQLSAAPGGAYTTQIGSYFKLSPMSASGSNTSIGTWA
jgi:hypothetical protein